MEQEVGDGKKELFYATKDCPNCYCHVGIRKVVILIEGDSLIR